jgi:hypothetical protein
MKNRKIFRFRKAIGLESGSSSAPGLAPRLMRGPDDMPHYRAFPVSPPKPILGCHPRLLSKLLL